MDINNVVLIGRLTRDAEVKKTAAGKSVARLALAVNRRVKRGDEWKDEANYFDLVLWGNEGIHKYLVKGKQIGISGELCQNRWEKDGQKHSRVEISVLNIQLLGGGENRGGGESPPASGRYDGDDVTF
jgi:single-strand DNA-binding protein